MFFFVHLIFNLFFDVKFLFNNNWYIQKDGVAMGSPLAPSMATIFMNECETKLSNYEGIKPKFYSRYVDDIFAIFENKSQCTSFLSFLNNKQLDSPYH